VVEVDDGSSEAADVVAVGRRPRIRDVGLETVGVDTAGKGLPIHDTCRLGAGLFFVGLKSWEDP
jgi:dihydrolipoamide dehydrogenase